MTIYIFLVLIIIILLVLIYHKKKDIENFTSSNDSSNYLFPTRDLQGICEEEYNLYPAYGATQCMENGKPNPYANCKCADEFGTCKVCYPTQKKYESGSNVVYDATNSFS
jgi:hypothetical protein